MMKILKKCYLILPIVIVANFAYADTTTIKTTPQQDKVIEQLTKDSVTVFNTNYLQIEKFKSADAKIKYNNPALGLCLDNSFSPKGWYNFRQQTITNYVLSKNISQIQKEMAILTPNFVKYMANVFSYNNNKTLVYSEKQFSGKVSLDAYKQTLKDFGIKPEYKDLFGAFLMPVNISPTDSDSE